MDEEGLIWFSTDKAIGAAFASGAEIGVDKAKKLGFEDGVVDKGTVFAVKLSRPYKLIDRHKYELTENDATKLIPINKAQHYKRIEPGMKLSSAVYALFESSQIYDTWKTVLKLLGYDGIIYAGKQYALIDDEIPIAFFDDMHMSEDAKNQAVESIRKWEENRAKAKEENAKKEEQIKDMQMEPIISNLVYCTNLFKFAAISDVLTALNVSDEIRQYVLSQPKDRMNHCVTALEQNKNIKSVNELEVAVNELLQSADKFDIDIIKSGLRVFSEGAAGQWALDNLRKLRKNNPILNIKNFQKMFPAWHNFIKWLVDDRTLLGSGGLLPADLQFSRQSFLDWYDGDVNRNVQGVNIRSMSIEQVAQAIRNWHEEQAAKGGGEKYQEDTANIVYGPKWHNPTFNGWTIRKVMSKNDLEVEGNKMNHCVGGYCDYVESGRSTIYSLRDPKNEPHVTLEAEDNNFDFAQIMGHSNSDPKKEYKEMIKEWFQSLMKSGKKIMAPGGDEDVNSRIYEAAQNIKYTHRPNNDWLSDVIDTESEYGVPVDNSGYSFDSAYDNVINGFSNRDNNYYGYMSGAAEPLVRLAIEQDIKLANAYDEALSDAENVSFATHVTKRWKNKSQIESIINKVQENNDTMFDHVIENYPPMPEESDFEDPEDYKLAYENYEDDVKYIDKEARQYLPYAFDDDLMEELHKQLASKPIALRPWMEGSYSYYLLNKKEEKKSA